MALSPETLNAWFTYHPPRGDQPARYATIRVAEGNARGGVNRIAGRINKWRSSCVEKFDPGPLYGEVHQVCRNLVEAIDAAAPDGAEKTAAFLCVRLARNAMNEHLRDVADNTDFALGAVLLDIAKAKLVEARWLACAAIALEEAPWLATPAIAWEGV